jgi:hypothetical protein
MSMTPLQQLLELSSAGLCPLPIEEANILSEYALGPELFKLLKFRNGFYAFESALHVFPVSCAANTEMDLERWNAEALWRRDYGNLVEGLLFFAEDIFQDQFCLSASGVVRFKAETGEIVFLAESIEQWADRILKNHRAETAWPFADQWQRQNGPLERGQRLMPKTPFFLGGEYRIENLWAGPAVEGMRFKADLARQTRNLKDGTDIRLQIRNLENPGNPGTRLTK